MANHQVWTIGHSNRTLDDFLALLTANTIETLADVRKLPGSRKWPHFDQDALAAALNNVGIAYRHFPELGGRRTQRRDDSPNLAWRVAAFRAYADYMLTEEFSLAFAELRKLAGRKRTVMMCAEVLPWRCHRRLLADQFMAQGWRVVDIMSPGKASEHSLPSFAKVENGQVTYPGELE